MSPDTNPVVVVLTRLHEAMPQGVPWALVGGLAVSARSEPRFTRDVDVAVAVADDHAAEAVTSALVAGGWFLDALVEQEATDRLAQVRLRPPEPAGVVCDLLFASSGIEPEIAGAAELLEIVPDVVVPVARTGHLIALKLLSVDDRRLQDRLDLQGLSQVATDDDWAEAETAAVLVGERGFARGRDLASMVAQLRAASE
jgi:predicted nucleotidyltransferase